MHKTDFLLDLIKIIAEYYVISDKWSEEYKGKDMKILDGSDGAKVLKTKQNHENIVGTEVISEGMFRWKIRVNKFKYHEGYWHIYIGVINLTNVYI